MTKCTTRIICGSKLAIAPTSKMRFDGRDGWIHDQSTFLGNIMDQVQS